MSSAALATGHKQIKLPVQVKIADSDWQQLLKLPGIDPGTLHMQRICYCCIMTLFLIGQCTARLYGWQSTQG